MTTLQVVKQQMQAGLHGSTQDALRNILRSEGFRGFYAGFLSTVAREIPFDAIEFALYEVSIGTAACFTLLVRILASSCNCSS